ncbi:MAG TPA: hypothetical protein VKR06_46040 [Ktedonosporobacter sp.]|nr:hypothetical protein [Ktedonosporobacter sp.]
MSKKYPTLGETFPLPSLDLPTLPALDELQEALAALEYAEAQLKIAKQKLTEAVFALPSKIGDNEDLQDEIASQLYWLDTRVAASDVKKAFRVVAPGQGPAKNRRVLKSAWVEMSCLSCQRSFQYEITSKYALSGHSWSSACKECRAKHDQAYRQRWEREREAEAQRLEVLRTMPYHEYLQTPEWHERRLRAMKRAGFHCQVCNASRVRLNVHHRTYERRGDEYDKDLITLCEYCHGIFHKNGKLAREEV